MFPDRVQTMITLSGDKSTNHEASVPTAGMLLARITWQNVGSGE